MNGRAYANWVLALLLLAYVLNFVDRQVLAIVSPEVKQEMGLSDTELGWLLGPAFALSFTLGGVVACVLVSDAGSSVALGGHSRRDLSASTR